MNDQALLYVAAMHGDLNGDVVRVSIQQGTQIVARFELPTGELLKAIMGTVTPVTLIRRDEKGNLGEPYNRFRSSAR